MKVPENNRARSSRWVAAVGILGCVFMLAFIAWSFSRHGTVGLFRVNGLFHWAFLLLGLLAVVLAVVTFFAVCSTRRRVWLKVLAVVLALPLIVIPAFAFPYVYGAFSPALGDTPVRLLVADGVGAYGVPDIAVVFNTVEPTRNSLLWGWEGVTDSVEEEAAVWDHVFTLRDLRPDTEYYYSLNNGPSILFSTPGTGGVLHLAVASDAHFGAGTARNDLTAELLAAVADPANGYDMFFYLGDLVEYGFNENEWQEAFLALADVTSAIPVRFAAGNHDTIFTGLDRYLEFCYPEGMDVQTGSRLWYRVDIGPVHFLVLDLEWTAETYTAEQAAWLEAQLQDIPDDEWKIVMSHGYYFASGLRIAGWNWYDNPETIDVLTPLFEKYGVDMVLCGHNHRMELLEQNGIVYGIAAAFGGMPDPAETYVSPASLWDGGGQYGFIDVTLDGDRCDLVFRGPQYEPLETYSFTRR